MTAAESGCAPSCPARFCVAAGTGNALDKDRGFLKEGGVFTDDVIDAYIALKMQEVTKLRMSTHPVEVELYYSV